MVATPRLIQGLILAILAELDAFDVKFCQASGASQKALMGDLIEWFSNLPLGLHRVFFRLSLQTVFSLPSLPKYLNLVVAIDHID